MVELLHTLDSINAVDEGLHVRVALFFAFSKKQHDLFVNISIFAKTMNTKKRCNTLIEEHSGRVQVGLPVHLLVLILVEGGVLLDCVVRFFDL